MLLLRFGILRGRDALGGRSSRRKEMFAPFGEGDLARVDRRSSKINFIYKSVKKKSF